MSTPDSVRTPMLVPVIPRLTVVPRPVSTRERAGQVLRELPVPVVVAAGLMAIQTVAFLAGRLLAVNLNYDVFIDSTETARALGIVSFMSIVVIAGAITMGHRGLRLLPQSQRVQRQLTAIVLGVAYLHLILWLTRVASAAVVASTVQSSALLMPSVFWWG